MLRLGQGLQGQLRLTFLQSRSLVQSQIFARRAPLRLTAAILTRQSQPFSTSFKVNHGSSSSSSSDNSTDPYEILGLSRNCSENDLREAYLFLSRSYHPDNPKNKDEPEKYKAKFIAVQQAYKELSKNKTVMGKDFGAGTESALFYDNYTDQKIEYHYKTEPLSVRDAVDEEPPEIQVIEYPMVAINSMIKFLLYSIPLIIALELFFPKWFEHRLHRIFIFFGMKPEDRFEHKIIKDDPFKKFNVQEMTGRARHDLRDELNDNLDMTKKEIEDEILEKEMEALMKQYSSGTIRK